MYSCVRSYKHQTRVNKCQHKYISKDSPNYGLNEHAAVLKILVIVENTLRRLTYCKGCIFWTRVYQIYGPIRQKSLSTNQMAVLWYGISQGNITGCIVSTMVIRYEAAFQSLAWTHSISSTKLWRMHILLVHLNYALPTLCQYFAVGSPTSTSNASWIIRNDLRTRI